MAYHIYGDSNIVRYLSAMKSRSADPQYQTITYTKTTNLVLLRDSLSKPDVGHPIIVVSALTNLLTAKFFDNYVLMIGHCRTTFTDLQTWIQEGRDAVDGFAQQVRFNSHPVPSCGIVHHRLSVPSLGLFWIYFAYRSWSSRLWFVRYHSGTPDGITPFCWCSTTLFTSRISPESSFSLPSQIPSTTPIVSISLKNVGPGSSLALSPAPGFTYTSDYAWETAFDNFVTYDWKNLYTILRGRLWAYLFTVFLHSGRLLVATELY